jgi:transposase
MGRVIKVQLTDNQQKELENGYRNGKSHAFRVRCQMVLLKSEGRKSKEIADFLGFCQQAINLWLKRYKLEGINGLLIREGRGRPRILSETEDSETVKEAVKRHRQRISIAKAELEENLGKDFSQKTLERFLKNLTAAINESESV